MATPPQNPPATLVEQALAQGDAKALLDALAEDPGGIARMEAPPYKHAIAAMDERLYFMIATGAQIKAMIALFDVIHAHASDQQNSPKALRLAAEKASSRNGLNDLLIWFLDHGAPLSHQIASTLLHGIEKDPDHALPATRMAQWKSANNFKRQQWEHQALCTMVGAGACVEALDRFCDHMLSPFSRKHMANALRILVIASEGFSMMGRGMKGTPQSVGWMQLRMGKRGVERILDEIDPDRQVVSVAYFQAQLDAWRLEQASHQANASMGPPRL